MTYAEIVKGLNTEANRIEWNETPEKFTFCLDLLDLSANDRHCDWLINKLEYAFVESLIADKILPESEALSLPESEV